MRPIDADALFAKIKERHDMFADCEYIGDKARRDELGAFMGDIVNAPTIGGWISVKDRLPPNADHPGAFCPRYQVMTKYGVTDGWYNPDYGCWYTLVWFYLGRKTFDDIDFERGDIPGITDKIEVTHWKKMPEPPREDEKEAKTDERV